MQRALVAVLLAAVAAGCDGKALLNARTEGGRYQDGGVAELPALPSGVEITASGMHRLTRDEYDNTLRDLLADGTYAGRQRLPEDVTDPFDNDYATQQVSGALVETVEGLAQEAAARALSDLAKREVLVPCQPQGPDDAACLRTFVEKFGRRALRQTLTEDDVQRYLALGAVAVEANDFWVGVDLVIRAMLQDPRFLYRPEVGTPVKDKPGVYALDDWEIAARLSYFVWGSSPPDWLLDLAEQKALRDPAQRRAAAEKLLSDPRARERVDRFHALWFGYHQLPHSAALTAAMRAESAALVKKVVFDDNADYFQLFLADQTYVDATLANHYGLPAPAGGGFAWVSYGASGRKGILGHGSALSQGAKFSDTSPTQRGIWVRARLLCTEIPPPPANVNADLAPEATNGGQCKQDRYAAHANVGSCYACHQLTDPIGWGLERFDKEGKYRTHDDGNTSCTLDGNGKISGVGDFNGPGGLAELLVQSGKLEQCIATQMFRFAYGRRETTSDQYTVANWVTAWKAKNRSFRELLLTVVEDNTFTLRKEE